MIPLSAPDVTEQEIEAVAAVLRSSQLSLGPKLEEFEARFAAYIGAPYAVAVNSGTSGLHLCVRALDLRAGDVDIDPSTLNIDPARVEDAITAHTRAILVVHTFGVPAEMDALEEIAQRYRLRILEDACEAIGATYREKKVGTFGAAGVFAFYPNKQITTGEGGMIVTADAQMAERVRALRNQGRYPSADWFQHREVGFNYRLSEINCALGIEQLKRIDAILAMRDEVARAYDRQLQGIDEITLPVRGAAHMRCSWFVYVVRLKREDGPALPDAVAAHLQSLGIGCGRYFAPIHMQPAYEQWRGSHLPITEGEAATTLALPFFNRLSLEQVEQVCAAVRDALTL
jgi:perosamine synthetase